MLDAIFRLLFNYRPVVFQQGEFRFVPSTGAYIAAVVVVAAIAITFLTYRRTRSEGPTRHRAVLAAIRLATLLLVSTVAALPVYSPESLARYFRLDWQVVPSSGGPTLEGYVYNQTDMLATQMQLNIEELDSAGNVTGKTGTWVIGEVPPGLAATAASMVEGATA